MFFFYFCVLVTNSQAVALARESGDARSAKENSDFSKMRIYYSKQIIEKIILFHRVRPPDNTVEISTKNEANKIIDIRNFTTKKHENLHVANVTVVHNGIQNKKVRKRLVVEKFSLFITKFRNHSKFSKTKLNHYFENNNKTQKIQNKVIKYNNTIVKILTNKDINISMIGTSSRL